MPFQVDFDSFFTRRRRRCVFELDERLRRVHTIGFNDTSINLEKLHEVQ